MLLPMNFYRYQPIKAFGKSSFFVMVGSLSDHPWWARSGDLFWQL